MWIGFQRLLCCYICYGACGVLSIYENGDMHLLTDAWPACPECHRPQCPWPSQRDEEDDNVYLVDALH